MTSTQHLGELTDTASLSNKVFAEFLELIVETHQTCNAGTYQLDWVFLVGFSTGNTSSLLMKKHVASLAEKFGVRPQLDTWCVFRPSFLLWDLHLI